jgi:hypothetical protein
MASSHAAAVREAVKVAVHTYQENPSTRKAKLPLGLFQQKGKQKMELMKTIVEITLEHHLRMFHRHTVKATLLISLSSARH